MATAAGLDDLAREFARTRFELKQELGRQNPPTGAGKTGRPRKDAPEKVGISDMPTFSKMQVERQRQVAKVPPEVLDKVFHVAEAGQQIPSEDDLAREFARTRFELKQELGRQNPAMSKAEAGAEGGRGKKARASDARAFTPKQVHRHRKLAKVAPEVVEKVFHAAEVGQQIPSEDDLAREFARTRFELKQELGRQNPPMTKAKAGAEGGRGKKARTSDVRAFTPKQVHRHRQGRDESHSTRYPHPPESELHHGAGRVTWRLPSEQLRRHRGARRRRRFALPCRGRSGVRAAP